MKRLLACLLVLLLPFTTCCASSVSDAFTAAQEVQNTSPAADSAAMAEGYHLALNVQSPSMNPIAANGFVGVKDESLILQAEIPQMNPFTLLINAAGEMKLLADSQWYEIVTDTTPAASQMTIDPIGLEAALENDLPLLLPVIAPAFEELPLTPAVVLFGLKVDNMIDQGVFSFSGSDLTMVLNEVVLALKKIDRDALAALTPKLQLGEVYLQLLEELPSMLAELTEVEFQLKGNLKDEERGFVSLVFDDFEFTVNYHEDDNLDLIMLDGLLRINSVPMTFDAAIGEDVTINYQAANVHGAVVAIPMTEGVSVSGVHYTTTTTGNHMMLESLWSADLVIQDNGFILAADMDDNDRCFVDFKFEQNPSTGSLTAASLTYQDLENKHALSLLSVGADAWQLGYEAYYRGKMNGMLTLTATPAAASISQPAGELLKVSPEDALSLVQPAPQGTNP